MNVNLFQILWETLKEGIKRVKETIKKLFKKIIRISFQGKGKQENGTDPTIIHFVDDEESE